MKPVAAWALGIALAVLLGYMAVVGFGQMWLGWSHCQSDNKDWAEDCAGDSILPLFGGLLVPIGLVLGAVGLIVAYAKERRANQES